MSPPSDQSPRDASGDQKRAHLITSMILVGVVGTIALIVSYPMLLLWILLAIAAVMAYAAVYLLVSARLEEEAPASPSSLPDPLPDSTSDTGPRPKETP